MKAERLYYADAYATTFDATVVEAGAVEGRPFVALDRTLFYPTSGGQPHDVGRLGEAAVVEVADREDGQVLHVLDRSLAVGANVDGTIDWARRFDHMQQHTGQHVLSAAFDRLFQARTVSFHLGTTGSTIDLDRVLSADSVARAEREANRILWDDRLVGVRFVTPEEAAALPLRKEPQREGLVRLVEVPGCDLSACGGTHVRSTGAVGLIALSSWEKFKGGLRVEFLCGGRALAAYRSLRDAIAGSVRALSVLPGELPAAIERSQAEGKQLRKTIRDLTEKLARHEALTLAARGTAAGGFMLVAESLEGWDASGLKAMATAVAARSGHIAALVSGAPPLLVAVACAPDTAAAVDASAIVRTLIERFGGKGGGRADLAQGGGLDASPTLVLDAIRQLVK